MSDLAAGFLRTAHAPVAQWIEQLVSTQSVAGSTPAGRAIHDVPTPAEAGFGHAFWQTIPFLPNSAGQDGIGFPAEIEAMITRPAASTDCGDCCGIGWLALVTTP